MELSASSIAALVVAVAFAAGLNVYATIATLGLLARMEWVTLPAGLEVLGHTWVIVVAGTLFVVEIFADKIPGFDLFWNAAHTFIRVPVAALMSYKAASQLSPEMQMAATLGGGLIAALAHTSKTAARALVTPSPEPISNIALSATEDIGAIGLTWVAAHHPYVGGAVAGLLVLGVLLCLRWIVKILRRMWREFRTPRSRAGGRVIDAR